MYEQTIQRLVDHYTTLAMNPATLEHARHMVRIFRDDPSGLFAELPELIKQRLDELKGKQ